MAIVSRVKTGLIPILPMTTPTIAAQTDLLIGKMHEWDTGQRMADRARSEMHCIIAALPGEARQGEVGTPPTPHGNEWAPHSLWESRGNARNRPVVVPTAPPEVVRVEPLPTSVPKPKTSKSSATRMNSLEKKARIQEALLYRKENPHLTLEQAATHLGLEIKALSRSYANKLKKAMPPDRNKTPKDEADDFLYNEKRRKIW